MYVTRTTSKNVPGKNVEIGLYDMTALVPVAVMLLFGPWGIMTELVPEFVYPYLTVHVPLILLFASPFITHPFMSVILIGLPQDPSGLETAVHGQGNAKLDVIGRPPVQLVPTPGFAVYPPDTTVPDNPRDAHVLFVVVHVCELQQN